ncbi:hypothetical protein MKW94_005084 [Papaver nudicaule]|uniref:Uncharacterized protein n=1 Tax=Papaver nudicaule TaxID=74823 RepID=A0AA41SCC7_PAPNU|nr:hypothetical protein [Papaver nudicaule]
MEDKLLAGRIEEGVAPPPNDILRIIKKIDRDGKEHLLLSDRCTDSDIDTDDDEQIYVPNKSKWFSMCMEKWGVEDDDSLIHKVRAAEIVFEIFTAGFRNEDGDSCCGALIRDSCNRPIVGISKVLPDGKSVSPFCLELEGVALGVNLAKKYEAFPFYLYCPSLKVCDFVEGYESEQNACYCSGARKVVKTPCEACAKRSTIPKGHGDYDKASEIVRDIFSDYEGHKGFNVIYGGSRGGSGTNEAACSLAKRGKSEELKLKDIGAAEDLWDTIYEEVFDQYVK